MPFIPFIGFSTLMHLLIIGWHALGTRPQPVLARVAASTSTKAKQAASLAIMLGIMSTIFFTAGTMLYRSVESEHSSFHVASRYAATHDLSIDPSILTDLTILHYQRNQDAHHIALADYEMSQMCALEEF